MSKEEIFVKEFVIGVGFLGGLFARIGIDPETEIIRALTSVFRFDPRPILLISLLLTISSFLVAYFRGGLLGLVAVLFGLIGGLLIIDNSIAGTMFLILGIISRLIATRGDFCLDL